jgi:uncharacterized protein YegL
MLGSKISELNIAVNDMIKSFKGENQNEATIQMAIITFGGEVNLALPLKDVANITDFKLQANGDTPMGVALEMAKAMIEDKEIIPSNGYRPTVVLVSDGQPNDSWQEPLKAFISSGRSSKCDRFAMAIGEDADKNVLNTFLQGTENPLFYAKDAKSISQFFRRVTMSVSVRSKSSNPNMVKALPFDSKSSNASKLELNCDF